MNKRSDELYKRIIKEMRELHKMIIIKEVRVNSYLFIFHLLLIQFSLGEIIYRYDSNF